MNEKKPMTDVAGAPNGVRETGKLNVSFSKETNSTIQICNAEGGESDLQQDYSAMGLMRAHENPKAKPPLIASISSATTALTFNSNE